MLARQKWCFDKSTSSTTTTSLEEASRDSDVVLEAVYEDLDLKQQIFRDLDAFCPDRTILASSTSTIIPSRFAEVTRRPDRVLVAHYTGPSSLSPLVEVVCTEQTSDETVGIVFQLLTKVGKTGEGPKRDPRNHRNPP